MNQIRLTGFILLLAILLVIPVVASQGGQGGQGGQDGQQPIDIDVNNEFSPTFSPDFNPEIDVDNYNANLNLNVNNNKNTNNNVNNNYVDVDQSQKQNQIQTQVQVQWQLQDQNQEQHQENTQIVNVPIPTGKDGGILLSHSNDAPKVLKLDVGEARTFSRLVYPDEVLPFEVNPGDVVVVKAASDVAIYTIGSESNDIFKLNSLESTPSYNPVYHKFEWGIVVPIDKIDYWTEKGTITAGNDATYVVIDNRAPLRSYTHVDVTITGKPAPEPVHQTVTFYNMTQEAGNDTA